MQNSLKFFLFLFYFNILILKKTDIKITENYSVVYVCEHKFASSLIILV